MVHLRFCTILTKIVRKSIPNGTLTILSKIVGKSILNGTLTILYNSHKNRREIHSEWYTYDSVQFSQKSLGNPFRLVHLRFCTILTKIVGKSIPIGTLTIRNGFPYDFCENCTES